MLRTRNQICAGLVVLLALSLSPCLAKADTTLTNSPAWDGTSGISTFGNPNTTTYGQTFTVGADTDLNDFSFYLEQFDGNSFDFRAYVMEWTGTQAAGPVPYQSAIANYKPTYSFVNYSFDTGSLALITGTQYVAFLSIPGDLYQTNGTAEMAITNGDTIPGGNFVYSNNSGTFASLMANAWNCDPYGCYVDAAFTAHFSSPTVNTPEPASFLLPGSGLAGLAGMRRRQPK